MNYDLTTGGNSTNLNTGGGTISTGSVTTETNVKNIANSPAGMLWLINTADCDGCDLSALDPSKYILFDASALAINANTGTNSSNTADTSSNNNVTEDITNTGNVKNNISIKANTGNNHADANTGSATINTGSINVATNILNLVNTVAQAGQRFTFGIINILGKWSGKAQIAHNAPAPQNTQNSGTSGGAQTNTSSSNAPVAPTSQTTTATTAFSITAPVSSPTPTPSFQPLVAFNHLVGHTLNPPGTSSSSTGNSSDNNTVTTTNTFQNNPHNGTGSFTITVDPPASTNVSGPWWQHPFIAVAHAASKTGLTGNDHFPYYWLLAIPLGIWGLAEASLTLIGRRRKVEK